MYEMMNVRTYVPPKIHVCSAIAFVSHPTQAIPGVDETCTYTRSHVSLSNRRLLSQTLSLIAPGFMAFHGW